VENIREEIRNTWNELRNKHGMKIPSLREDEHAVAVLATIVTFIILVIAIMVLVIVLANLWPTFTTSLTSYANNETTFGPTVKSLTPLLIGVAVLLVVLALIFGMQVFREGGLFG